MDRMTQFYIGGEWVAPVSGETMPVMNPANGERLGIVALGNAEDVDRAVAAATAAFDGFSLTSKADRLALLRRIREVSERRLEELGQTAWARTAGPAPRRAATAADHSARSARAPRLPRTTASESCARPPAACRHTPRGSSAPGHRGSSSRQRPARPGIPRSPPSDCWRPGKRPLRS